MLPTLKEIDWKADPEQTAKNLAKIKDGEVYYTINTTPGVDYSLKKYSNPSERNKMLV